MVQIIEINKKRYEPCTAQQKIETAERIKKMRKEGEKPIKGMFEFIDAQGGWLDFSFRYFEGPIQTIKIIHGEVCELPTILVKHLNNVYKKVRMMPDNLDLGKPVVTKISRCRFTPMDVIV